MKIADSVWFWVCTWGIMNKWGITPPSTGLSGTQFNTYSKFKQSFTLELFVWDLPLLLSCGVESIACQPSYPGGRSGRVIQTSFHEWKFLHNYIVKSVNSYVNQFSINLNKHKRTTYILLGYAYIYILYMYHEKLSQTEYIRKKTSL
jgi:hypothetical protein